MAAEPPLTAAELAALTARGWFVRDAVLGASAGHAVRAAIEALWRGGGLRPAGVSRGASFRRDPDTRGDAIAWLTLETAPAALVPLQAWFRALRDALNRQAYLGLDEIEVQVARYPGDGARYRRHRDAFATVPGDRPDRRVTAIYYPNADWRPADGGQLRLHPPGPPVDLDPVLDRAVVFLSEEVEHEVLPVFAPRVAVTGWLRARSPLGG
jgi:SM-20-related protein